MAEAACAADAVPSYPTMHSTEPWQLPHIAQHRGLVVPWWLPGVERTLLERGVFAAEPQRLEALRGRQQKLSAAYAAAESYRPPQQLARIGHAELVEAGTFMVDHIRRSVPVVVTGVATSWPAMRRWSTAFLSSGELGDAEVHCDGLWGGRSLLINRTHLIKGRRRRMRMRAFVDRLRMQAARPGPTAMVGALEDPWALINAARDDELFWTLDGKNMSSHYPALLRDADPPNLLLFPPYARLYKLNLWASGYKFTPPHYDNSENLLLQVAGEKSVRMWPPTLDALRALQPRLLRHLHPGLLGPDAPAQFENVYGTISDAEGAWGVVLRPGELLYIPRGWYHTVESTVAAAAAPGEAEDASTTTTTTTTTTATTTLEGVNLAINYWYESAPPMDSFFELAFEQLKSYATAAERDDKRRGLLAT